MLDGARLNMVREVSRLLHAQKHRDAAELFSDFAQLGIKLESDDPKVCSVPLLHLLHWLLDRGEPASAAGMLWTPKQFSISPASVKAIWNFFDETSTGIIMSAGAMGKSYTIGGRLFLEWIRDPAWTTVKVIGPTETHLEENLFSHLVALHQSATLPMPGEVGDLFIGLDRRNRISSISGQVIPVGKTKKSGRLQGIHPKPRPESHPTHGDLSRIFILIDEWENVPTGIFGDVDNLMSNMAEGSTGGMKIIGCYNPSDITHEVAKRAEPEKGWENFDIENDYRWKSRRGWDVLRLDAERCENVVQNKVLYPGLQTRAGLDRIAKNAGGTKSKGYYTQGRGAYPPQGAIEMAVFPAGLLGKMIGEFIWLSDPIAVGSADLALMGGAYAVFTIGRWGQATGVKFPPSLEFPKGRIVMFKNARGQATTRWGLQADNQFVLPKGATVQMKDKIIDIARKAGIRPEYLGLDRTGNGAGVCDLVRHEWGPGIQDVNFSESATDMKVMLEDAKIAKETYDRVASELWFATKKYGEFGFLMLHPQMSLEKLSPQLLQRHFSVVNKKDKVESKADFIARGFTSPDEGDSLTLLVYAVRKGSGITLSMAGGESSSAEDLEDSWDDGKAWIDASNRTDCLEV